MSLEISNCKCFLFTEGVLMESVKNGLLNFCKGFGIWFVLLILNTRSGEASVNGLKIILDTVLALGDLSNNIFEPRYVSYISNKE